MANASQRPRSSPTSHRCAEGYGVKQAQRMMALSFRDQQIPTVEEFAEAIARENIVAIRFSPA